MFLKPNRQIEMKISALKLLQKEWPNELRKQFDNFNVPYFIEYSAHFFIIENDAEIFPVNFTWKVAEKGFNMTFKKKNLQWLILVKLFLKNKFKKYAKNHDEIHVRTTLICTLYSIKYGNNESLLGPSQITWIYSHMKSSFLEWQHLSQVL
jgi:hypothetical protein